jgi:ubiquinone/menaquinone biosynthesis C-methylase UbiE
VTDVTELERVHARWLDCTREAWRAAGLRAGQRVLDLGCGPGLVTIELAQLVGPAGRVVALDRAPHLLDVLGRAARERQLRNIEIVEADFDREPFAAGTFDVVWMRWVTAFAADPHDLITRVAAAVAPGGLVISQEFGETREIQAWLAAAGLSVTTIAGSDEVTTVVATRR